MKRLLEVIPFLLLTGLVPSFYYSNPNIPQALIIFSISLLCGYRYYSMEQVKPDYSKIFSEELQLYKDTRDQELKVITDRHEKAMVFLEAKVKELSSNYGKMTMEKTQPKKEASFTF